MKNPFHNINDDSHKEKLDLEHFIKPTMNLKKGKKKPECYKSKLWRENQWKEENPTPKQLRQYQLVR